MYPNQIQNSKRTNAQTFLHPSVVIHRILLNEPSKQNKTNNKEKKNRYPPKRQHLYSRKYSVCTQMLVDSGAAQVELFFFLGGGGDGIWGQRYDEVRKKKISVK